MKKYSVDTYDFKSHLTDKQIHDRLNQRTLKKKYLTMESTDKDFIRRIQEDKFEIFQASFLPYGAACILGGTISSTSNIKVTTSLHNGFRILFVVWVVAITTLFIVTWFIGSRQFDGLIAFIIGMPIMTFLFRLFLHGVYVLARDKGLKKLKDVLDIGQND